ncbi:PREDICTED: uncharacterized protein C1orf131 homolog [Dufourea novaeangliae]|uniref:uncharacterized protein C1orf131 homolog n=1 Tax=Dufourea novaeangliae TaxID=178035 RepID=UPI00076750BA|nr:PREDICTED: uncharacterized protein C1orf131 homolog [Dufourea novaeangliae]
MADFIPTRVSKLVKRHAVEEFISVNYEAPMKKPKKNCKSDEEKDVHTVNENVKVNGRDKDIDQKKKQDLEMKRVRYEVMKFGMSGFEKAKANNAKVQLAISLGAKPFKNKAINYKTLKHQRSTQKEMQKNEEHVSGLERSMKKHKTIKTKKKRSSGILDDYGKVNKKTENKKKR